MDTAAFVDRMVDSYNRHDIDALAACYAPDAQSTTPAGWRTSMPRPGWPSSAVRS
jgi:hypothetical protein